MGRVNVYIGIDPGQSGGIAVILEDEVRAAKMPATEREIFLMLDQYARPHVKARAVLERVGVMPRQGIVSAFTFGKGVGGLRMALAAAGISFDEVTPQRWQKALGCLSGGDKNITKARAQRLFPRLTVTHAIADALLIAEYCRRMEAGGYGEAEKREGAEAGAQSLGRTGCKAEGRRGLGAEGAAVSAAPRHGTGAKPSAR